MTQNDDSFLLLMIISFLVASMGLQMIWSFGLACLDVYAIRRKSDLRSPVLLSLFTVGDWVLLLILSSFSVFYQIKFQSKWFWFGC